MAPLLVEVGFGTAAELDLAADLRPGDLPGVPVAQPLVRHFVLPAVADLLVEEPELVPDAVADRRDLERGERVEEAAGQPSEPTVAQARLLFLLEQHAEVQAELRHGLPCRLLDPEVREVVAQVRPGQELGRQVGDHLHVALEVGLHGPHPSVQQPVAHRMGKGQVPVVCGRERREHGLDVGEVVDDGAPECARVGARADVFGQGVLPVMLARGAPGGARPLLRRLISLRGHLSCRTATPGSSRPSRNSSEAPPPVETCVILW
jgi:hypothetical protein